MKKGKILATILAGAMLLSAAFTMQASAAAADVVKDGTFPAGTTAWKCLADEDKTPDKPMKFEAGKVVLTEDTSNWLHLKQTVTVKPETKYTFSITYKLTAGALRFDVPVPGKDNPNEISCDMYQKGQMAKYGTEQTFETTITTAAGQTEFTLDIRNNCGDLGQAVGEITKVSLVELNASGKPGDGTAQQPGGNDTNKGDSPQHGRCVSGSRSLRGAVLRRCFGGIEKKVIPGS